METLIGSWITIIRPCVIQKKLQEPHSCWKARRAHNIEALVHIKSFFSLRRYSFHLVRFLLSIQRVYICREYGTPGSGMYYARFVRPYLQSAAFHNIEFLFFSPGTRVFNWLTWQRYYDNQSKKFVSCIFQYITKLFYIQKNLKDIIVEKQRLPGLIT